MGDGAVKPLRRVGIVAAFGLGDCVQTLPMAGVLKAAWPRTEIVWIAPASLKPLFDACEYTHDFAGAEAAQDDFRVLSRLQLDALLNPFPHLEVAQSAAKARIPLRIGNLRRPKHVPYCNRFVFYGRRSSGLHEAELNLKDLRALGIRWNLPRAEIAHHFGLTRVPPLVPEVAGLLDPSRFNLVLHAKSKGSAREWPLASFLALARGLDNGAFRIFLTGSREERAAVARDCPELLGLGHVVDLFGRFDLAQFASFLRQADGVIAASTGPLHLAAALGTRVLGLYVPRTDIGAVRWGPIGAQAAVLCGEGPCPVAGNCGGHCVCMQRIAPARVTEAVTAWAGQRAGLGERPRS